MTHTEPAVKPRRYDATRRQDAAARTRSRVLDTAEQLLLRDGYAATTVSAIAEAAQVSDVLIYKRFGGKAGLVAEIQRRGLEGAGPVPAPERSDATAAGNQPASELLQSWAALATEVTPRTAPIMLLVRDAATTDPELATLHERMTQQRLDRMTINARRLTQHTGTRPELTVNRIRDILWTVTSPELYDMLIQQRGWTLSSYGDFLNATMASQLLQSTHNESEKNRRRKQGTRRHQQRIDPP